MSPTEADLLRGTARIYFNDGSGFRNFGNIPEISLTRNIEEITHFEGKDGKLLLGKTQVKKAQFGLKYKIDQLDDLNLNDIIYGGGVADASYVSGSVVDEAHTTPSKLDRYIFTTKDQISNVVITDTVPNTPFVVDVDYTIENAALGIIKILSTGAITASLPLLIDYDYAAGVRSKLQVGKSFTIEGSARLEFAVESGSRLTWVIHKAALKVEGDTALSVENWSEAAMTLDILSDSANNPTEPYGYLLAG